MTGPGLEQALRDAVHFELLWLLNKRDYYGFILKTILSASNYLRIVGKYWVAIEIF